MSEFDDNPFAQPTNSNPFNDPSVTQVTNSTIEPVDQFNPFDTQSNDGLAARTIPASGSPTQPAVLQPSAEPSPQATAAAAQADLLRQQEELERKAAELDRREQELKTRNPTTGKVNNWPPLPKNCPIKPCFYQDFSEEIPQEYQRVSKMMYYLWMFHCMILFLNVLACLSYFIVDKSRGTSFGLSILWFILFAPCSFLCWFRPVYKAFKTDSSFSFFFFFFVFFFQVVILIIQAIGIPDWGNSGWITAFTIIGKSNEIGAGAIMMIVAILFTICAVMSVVLLKMVHSMYRRTGASFQKAQQEFSQGVFTSRSFQSAAAGAASSAAQGAFRGNP